MSALSELFDATTVLVPVSEPSDRPGQIAMRGRNLSVTPLTHPAGTGLGRKLLMIPWALINGPRMIRAALSADLIHSPVPGDVGTIGMLLAIMLRRSLFVRHCGNWDFQRTPAERFWRWFMEHYAGERRLMLATGGSDYPPSNRNSNIDWIFSTSLTMNELTACRNERAGIGKSKPRLITVGRLEHFKGVDSLIESMPLLLEKFPELTLDIVGDGQEKKSLQRLAAAAGVSGHVTFHGQQNHQQVIELLKGADLFCYPTRSDGFPKAVLEALACGLPVITTRVSVLPRLIGNGSGVLIDDTSPESIADAVEFCLTDDDRYRRISETAGATARKYSLENWRETIAAHLRAAGIDIRSHD